MDFNVEQGSLVQVRALLQQVFPTSPRFADEAFLNWLYLSSPDGAGIWRDAIIDGEVRAHYGSVPQYYHRYSAEALLHLSVNSATHEALRGRGAFTILGEAVYAAQRAERPDAVGVIGVPNRQALPPRVKRLHWTAYETLPLKVSIGVPLRHPAGVAGLASRLAIDPQVMPDAMFEARFGWRQKWTRDKLVWRASNPLEQVWLHRVGDAVAFAVVRRKMNCPAIATIVKTFVMPDKPQVELGDLVAHIRAVHRTPAVAHIGRNADVKFSGWLIPEAFRPSPLILGARMLVPSGLDVAAIDCFEAWDYDLF